MIIQSINNLGLIKSSNLNWFKHKSHTAIFFIFLFSSKYVGDVRKLKLEQIVLTPVLLK